MENWIIPNEELDKIGRGLQRLDKCPKEGDQNIQNVRLSRLKVNIPKEIEQDLDKGFSDFIVHETEGTTTINVLEFPSEEEAEAPIEGFKIFIQNNTEKYDTNEVPPNIGDDSAFFSSKKEDSPEGSIWHQLYVKKGSKLIIVSEIKKGNVEPRNIELAELILERIE